MVTVMPRVHRIRGLTVSRREEYLYNSLVLPHLQYCLMVWGDFSGDGNGSLSRSILSNQKRFVGLMAGKTKRYHADPLFARYGILKVGDLYREQLRIYAWQFWNGRLPQAQAAMLERLSRKTK